MAWGKVTLEHSRGEMEIMRVNKGSVRFLNFDEHSVESG